MLTRKVVGRATAVFKCRRACSGSGAGASSSPLRRLIADASEFGEVDAVTPDLLWATAPYAARAPRDDDGTPREQADPRSAVVLLFPGESAAFVGMGRKLEGLREARDLYSLASDVVGWDVWKTCIEGPAETLSQRAPTAVLVTSLAALEAARDQRPAALQRARAAAGFSLGELTALAAAGALPVERALRLAELRAAAVRAASAARPGAALTVWLTADARLGPALAAAREHGAERGLESPACAVAAYLHPGCRAVAGDEACIAWLERHGRSWGVLRSERAAAPALHSPLMAEAAAAMGAGLAAAGGAAAPKLRVVSALQGRALRSARDAGRALAAGLAAPVRWEQALHALYARPRGAAFPLTVALGPGGAALRTSLRRVNARAWDSSVQIDV